MKRKLATMLAVGGFVTAAPARGDDPLGAIEIGKPFPAVRLPALADGAPARLADFRGRRTVLLIFASW